MTCMCVLPRRWMRQLAETTRRNVTRNIIAVQENQDVLVVVVVVAITSTKSERKRLTFAY
jgi:hypothetical protein